jgi:hypothetical protein
MYSRHSYIVEGALFQWVPESEGEEEVEGLGAPKQKPICDMDRNPGAAPDIIGLFEPH